MRITDIIREVQEVDQTIIDHLTALDAEGLNSIGIDSLTSSLQKNGVAVDRDMVFDVVQNLAIVDNIKDDIVYFNSNSEESGYDNQVDPEKQDKTIDRMARKQTKKELNK